MTRRIGFTIGDPGGIGPELVFRTLSSWSKDDAFIPIVYGPKSLLSSQLWEPLLCDLDWSFYSPGDDLELGKVYYKPCADYSGELVFYAHPENGRVAYDAIRSCVADALESRIDAMVTAPICKEALQLAGKSLTDHTSLLTQLTGAESVSMAFYSEKIKTVLATVHTPLSLVSEQLTAQVLDCSIQHALLFGRLLGIQVPRVAVAGFNPHAGEGGMFGKEEQLQIAPVIDRHQRAGATVSGPYPADTLFFRASQNEFDVIVSLYHDQALIPIKLLAFHAAVNLTLGLPFIRTSPDYGTGFDLAYKKQVETGSFLEAVRLAIRLTV